MLILPKCTTGAALAAGEVLAGPFCKKDMRIKMQMLVTVLGLCLFSGIMTLGNGSRESLALSVSLFPLPHTPRGS